MIDQILANSNEDCEVKVSLLIENSSKAQCSISIKNRSSKNLYLFNRIFTKRTEAGLLHVDKNLFYAYINSDSVLILSKAIIKVPEEFFVESKVYPCCTKISPGEFFKEDLKIELPIHLYHPYIDEYPNHTLYPVYFQFGYFIGHDQTESMEIKVPSTEGEVICFDPFDYNFQKIIEVGLFNPLPVSN